MRFEQIQPEKYRAQVSDDMFIWLVCEGPEAWWWFVGGPDGYNEWGDNNGPYPTKDEATTSVVAKYKEYVGNTIVWWVHRPTSRGMVERPTLWGLEPVIAGSQRDRELASGRVANDAGELVELPGQWIRFGDQASAEAWMTEETRRYWRWYEWNSLNY
jgi:hypothetical protein